MKKFAALFLGFFLIILVSLELYRRSLITPGPAIPAPAKLASGYDLVPLSSPSPTPKPTLSPAEYETKYGPCIRVPILMYHHVNSTEEANAGGYSGLNVTPETFRTQLEYLRAKNYHIIPAVMLNDFFDRGSPLPDNPIILTFDDGYGDFTDVAAPILFEFNYPSTLFISTGLMENPGYSTWAKLSALNSSLFYLGNHTWSHHNMITNTKTVEFEIGTADAQLFERGLNKDRIFAYPYGPSSSTAINWLSSHSYTLAFTTTNNSFHCKGLRYTLGRIRVGNNSLSNYGL